MRCRALGVFADLWPVGDGQQAWRSSRSRTSFYRYDAKDHPAVIGVGGVQMLGERRRWGQREALTEVPSGLGQEQNPMAVHISHHYY